MPTARLFSSNGGLNCGPHAYKASVLSISDGPSATLQDLNIKKGSMGHQPRDTFYKMEKKYMGCGFFPRASRRKRTSYDFDLNTV